MWVTAPAGGEELLVLYGTQSGNAEWVAVQVQRLAAPRGPLGFVCWLDNQYLILTPRGAASVVSTGAPSTQKRPPSRRHASR